MPSFNSVTLVGNVTRDPELRYTPGGTAVCEVGLAVNRTWFNKATNQKEESCVFVDCTLWAKTAETAGQYVRKGSPLLIHGRLELDQWEDKATGQKRSKLKVVGEQMQMLGGKGGSDQSSNQSSAGESSQEVDDILDDAETPF